MTKRKNGDGSIYQRKDGRWVAQIYVRTSSQSVERRYIYGPDKDTVDAKLRELRDKVARQSFLTPQSLTVAAYLAEWLAHIVPNRVRPNTLASYQRYVNDWLMPALGKAKLEQLTARDVRVYLAALERQGKGTRSIRYVHATLRAALEDAVRDELITRNVAKLVRAPRSEKSGRPALTADQAKALLRVSADTRHRALFIVILMLGLRRSEVLGLRWADVDLVKRRLSVNQTLHREKTGLQLRPPKTQRSNRTMPLPEPIAVALGKHKERQAQDRETHADVWPGNDLVFTTPIGTAIEPRNCTRIFKAHAIKAGLPNVAMHSARHTCVTLLLEIGVPPRTVMEIVGHSAIEMTMNIYGHVTMEAQRGALDKLSDLLSE